MFHKPNFFFLIKRFGITIIDRFDSLCPSDRYQFNIPTNIHGRIRIKLYFFFPVLYTVQEGQILCKLYDTIHNKQNEI